VPSPEAQRRLLRAVPDEIHRSCFPTRSADRLQGSIASWQCLPSGFEHKNTGIQYDGYANRGTLMAAFASLTADNEPTRIACQGIPQIDGTYDAGLGGPRGCIACFKSGRWAWIWWTENVAEALGTVWRHPDEFPVAAAWFQKHVLRRP
jgi:hypothetical protein